jgi:hypothetical protein
MSAGSGILPTSETLAIIDSLRKHNTSLAFALFKIEGTDVIPAGQYPDEAESKNFVASKKDTVSYAKNFEKNVWAQYLKAIEAADGPRFSVVDFAFLNKEDRFVNVLTSISYCPDKGTPAKQKMSFASTKTAFEAKINIGKKYNANDLSDLEYATVLSALADSK